MGGFFGGGKSTSTTTVEPVSNGIRIQTSAYGLVLPIVYGMTRICGNLIWYANFRAISHAQTQSQTVGGKGGGQTMSQTNISWTYQVGFALGLCEGPITGVIAAWADKDSVPVSRFSAYLGDYLQIPNLITGGLVAYPGVALVAADPYELGDKATLPNFTFVVQGRCLGYLQETVADESHPIEGTPISQDCNVPESPYQVTIDDWLDDAGVRYQDILGPGAPFTKVETPATAGEYSVTAGVYTFYADDAGMAVTISAVCSPVTATVNHLPLQEDLGITGFTKVAGTPASGEYAVNEATGVYTFNAADLGGTALISYVYGIAIGSYPDEVFQDLATSSRYGLGLDVSKFASLDNYRAYCQANSFFISPALIEAEDSQSIMARWLRITNSDLVWSEGKIKIIPYGDAPVTGNGGTWTPDLAPLYDLTIDDFLVDEGEVPVKCTRSTPADAFNHFQVEFLNSQNEYNPETAEYKDQTNIEDYGLKSASVFKAHEIIHGDQAAALAQIL